MTFTCVICVMRKTKAEESGRINQLPVDTEELLASHFKACFPASTWRISSRQLSLWRPPLPHQSSTMSTTTTASSSSCASPSCTKSISKRLACPKCIQLGLPPVYYCSQECFKENYAQHKQIHVLAKQMGAVTRCVS